MLQLVCLKEKHWFLNPFNRKIILILSRYHKKMDILHNKKPSDLQEMHKFYEASNTQSFPVFVLSSSEIHLFLIPVNILS